MAVAPTRATLHAGNLPVELTSFVGRRQGLAELKRALASTRLLTLTGAGGVGKTKLALRAGRESARQYPDGVWFVELAPIQDPELVPQAVFTALGLQDHSSSWAVSTLSDYLADKRPLLILDNCEHVHDAAAVLAGTLLRACPDLRILATSRQALGVTGEVVIDVPTLSLPEDGDASPETLLRSDAVALFVERAGAVQQGFAVDAANAAAILSVCTHLDGIPLALELAAVRLKSLGLDALDRGLAARLGALGTGDRSAIAPAADARGRDRLELPAPERARATAVGPPVRVRRRVRARRRAGGLRRRRAGSRGDPGARRVARREVRAQATTGRHRRPLPAPRTASPVRPRAASGGRRRRRSFGARHRDWIIELATVAGANDARQVEAFERIRVERANVWSALDFCLSDPAEAESGAAICQGSVALLGLSGSGDRGPRACTPH